MPRVPLPLFQPEGADEGALGVPGEVNGVRLPRSSDGQKPPVVPRLQRLRVEGGSACRGTPVPSRPAPPRHTLSWFGHVPTRTPAAPPAGVRSAGGSLAPRSRRCRAHRPLVSTTPRISMARIRGFRAGRSGSGEAEEALLENTW